MHDDWGDRSAAARSNGRIRLTSKAFNSWKMLRVHVISNYFSFLVYHSDLSRIACCTFHLENTAESFDNFEGLLSVSFLEGNQVPKTRVDCVTRPENKDLSEAIFKSQNVVCNCDNKTDPSHSKTKECVKKTTGCEYEMHHNEIDRICGNCKDKSNCRTKTTGALEMEDSKQTVRSNIIDDVCMIGLHCCGPLTPTMIELFLHSENIRSLVCVSCCYHSMPVDGKIVIIIMQMQQCRPQNYVHHFL